MVSRLAGRARPGAANDNWSWVVAILVWTSLLGEANSFRKVAAAVVAASRELRLGSARKSAVRANPNGSGEPSCPRPKTSRSQVGRGVQNSPELSARGDTELRVDPRQMSGDRAMRDEKLLADLPVSQPVGGQAGDLQLLCRQLQTQVERARNRRFASRTELVRGSLGPGRRAERVEAGASGAQRPPCRHNLTMSSKPGALGEQKACAGERPAAEIRARRLRESGLDFRVVREHRACEGQARLKKRTSRACAEHLDRPEQRKGFSAGSSLR